MTDRPLRAARDMARRLGQQTGISITTEDVLESPYTLIGTVADLVAKLRRGRERRSINPLLAS